MADNPGAWHLWIGDEHNYNSWAVPWSPVITVEVNGEP